MEQGCEEDLGFETWLDDSKYEEKERNLSQEY